MSHIRDVGACDLLDKFHPLYHSTIVEALVNIRGRVVVLEDHCLYHQCISCCCVWRKVNLVDYVLSYLRLQELYYTILQALDVDVEVIFNVSSVLNIKF